MKLCAITWQQGLWRGAKVARGTTPRCSNHVMEEPECKCSRKGSSRCATVQMELRQQSLVDVVWHLLRIHASHPRDLSRMVAMAMQLEDAKCGSSYADG